MTPDKNPPILTSEPDLVALLLLLGEAKLSAILPSPKSHTRLLQFEVSDPTPRARQLVSEWDARRFAGSSPDLKTTSTIPVSVACRLNPAGRTIMHFIKTGAFPPCSKLVLEIEVALLALPPRP